MISPAWSAATAAVPPLTPDDDEARRWAEQELSRPVYAEAQPTPFDLFARGVTEFLADLLDPEIPTGWESVFAVVAVVVLVVLLVAALVIWGAPRATRRGVDRTAVLFGEPEARTAHELRVEADAAASRGRWDDAVVLRFRALARGLAERGVVDAPPGATVHAFARSAAAVFPSSADALEAAADGFDDVRYLRRPGSADLHREISRLDETLTSARPVALQAVPT
ncbi:MAG: hypothetical protein CMH34_14610 [Microbacterium sp.]|nr:hypothetical protein [Microbacterium sp.]